jgi:hypothetical protein
MMPFGVWQSLNRKICLEKIRCNAFVTSAKINHIISLTIRINTYFH